jgi:hypothetical protein
MVTSDKKLQNDLILAEFNQVFNDHRYYDQAMWQIPSVVITVSSVIFAVSFSFVHIFWVSSVILLFGALFDLTLAIVLTKHRISIDCKSVFLRQFVTKYGLEYMPFKTDNMLEYIMKDYGAESEHRTHIWFRKRNAFQWTFYSILVFVVVLFVLGLYVLLNGLI